MRCKLIAMYTRPSNEDAFLSHYREVHTPLVEAVPGLEKLVVNMVTGSPMGETDLFMIAEMHFADRETFRTAMTSAQNKAAGKDLMNFAKGLVTVVFVEEA
jgi:uncharacterized protein (TIGR02118 family)